MNEAQLQVFKSFKHDVCNGCLMADREQIASDTGCCMGLENVFRYPEVNYAGGSCGQLHISDIIKGAIKLAMVTLWVHSNHKMSELRSRRTEKEKNNA